MLALTQNQYMPVKRSIMDDLVASYYVVRRPEALGRARKFSGFMQEGSVEGKECRSVAKARVRVLSHKVGW